MFGMLTRLTSSWSNVLNLAFISNLKIPGNKQKVLHFERKSIFLSHSISFLLRAKSIQKFIVL